MTKRSFALVASLMFAVACPGDEEPTMTTDNPVPECATITSSFPAADATNVYYRVTLSWEFSAADTSAAVTVADVDGNDVAGSGEWLGTTYIWTPSTPLTASASYTATMSYCDGENMPSTSFTVGTIGAAATPADLVDRAYILDISTDSAAQVIQPPGVGGTIQGLLEDPDNQVDILIGVTAADDTNITLIGALGDGATPVGQDICTTSIDFPAAAFGDNPFFNVGPQDLVLDVLDDPFTLKDLRVNGAFSASGDRIAGATLSGTIDTRELVPSLFEGQGDNAVCEAVAIFNVACEPCAGGGDFCLSALITNIEATELTDLTLEVISEPSTDPIACPPTPDPA